MSIYSTDPETGQSRPEPELDPVTDGQVTAQREAEANARAQWAMAREVQTLMYQAFADRAKYLRLTRDGGDKVDKCADLARLVRALADPRPLAAALGLQ